jgi:hypothetical protein
MRAVRGWNTGVLLFGSIAATALLVAVLLPPAGSPSAAEATTPTPTATPTPSGPGLSLDLDTTDGICSSIYVNPQRTVNAGTSFDVAICFQNKPYPNEGIIGMTFRVAYNDTIIRAPEVADAGAGVDDNPDANAGATTFSSPSLPAGWQCNVSGSNYPVGDFDGVPLNGAGEARSSCSWPNHPNPPFGALFNGVFSVIHFTAGATGTTSLNFTYGVVTPWSSGIGSSFGCPGTMYCFGGSITVDTPTATETPTPTATSILATDTPTATSTSAPATGTPTTTPGPGGPCDRADLTGDGKVTTLDVMVMAIHLAYAKKHHDARYDIDLDGKVTAKDLVIVVKCRNAEKQKHDQG